MSTRYELGDVVAQRRIEAFGADGTAQTVTLRLGKPFPDPLPGGDWCCPFQIDGLGDDSVDAAFGIDSLQALLLATWAAQLQLTERARLLSVRLDWLGQPDLGLKVDPEVHKLLPPPPADA